MLIFTASGLAATRSSSSAPRATDATESARRAEETPPPKIGIPAGSISSGSIDEADSSLSPGEEGTSSVLEYLSEDVTHLEGQVEERSKELQLELLKKLEVRPYHLKIDFSRAQGRRSYIIYMQYINQKGKSSLGVLDYTARFAFVLRIGWPFLRVELVVEVLQGPSGSSIRKPC